MGEIKLTAQDLRILHNALRDAITGTHDCLQTDTRENALITLWKLGHIEA